VCGALAGRRQRNQSRLQLSEALFNAGKTFNFLPLLGTHMVSDPLLRLRRQTRIVEFFDSVLKGRDKATDRDRTQPQ
jgi:hypothetical protein